MGPGKALGRAGAAEVEQAALKFDFSRLPSQHLPDGHRFLLALPERRQGTCVKFIPVPAARGDTAPSVPSWQLSAKEQSLAAPILPSEQQQPQYSVIPSIVSQSILAKTPNIKTH